MSPIAKRCRIGEHPMGNDLISNLPVHLITCILDLMPIQDAARTSILSKTWKNIWLSRSHVVLGDSFCHQLVSKKDLQSHQSLISEAVNKILLAHQGPIFKFCLFVPLKIDLRSHYNSWMSLLSTKEVEHLELENVRTNSPVPDSMPSDFFSFPKLRRVLLQNYRLDPPPNYQGFGNLTLVYLIHVTFATDMSFGPQLKQLSLMQCLGIHHLGPQFTHHNKNLHKLELLRAVILEVWDAYDYNKDAISCVRECIDMHRFLSSTPNMATLILNSVCFRFMVPRRTIGTGPMENMKTLVLYFVEFYDLHEILNVLSLIRSSPNLQHLKITVAPEAERKNPVDLRVEGYLGSSDCRKIVLNQLHTVEIGRALGSRAEFLFINLLRACSPSLKNLHCHPNTVAGVFVEEFEFAMGLENKLQLNGLQS